MKQNSLFNKWCQYNGQPPTKKKKKKKEYKHRPYNLHKNSKWIRGLTVKCKTMKYSKDNFGENPEDPGYSNVFF